MDTPKTLLEAINFFSDADNCRRFMVEVRWADGVVRCPTCGSDAVTYLANAKLYYCKAKHAKQKFSLKVGTIFEDSPIGLEKWLPASWLLGNCKNGISSYELARAIGVTQKSAWHMLHRIRTAMAEEGPKLGLNAPVEMDETFVGGKIKNMHKRKIDRTVNHIGGASKSIVFGMLERGGKVRAKVVADRKKASLMPNIKTHVEDGSHVISDEYSTYPFVTSSHFHEVINHAEGYVREHVHTNGIENFWSLLKRGLGGTYISVDPSHLQAYVEEQVFRYNTRRELDDFGRFKKVMSQVVGKRLTYADLTGRVPL